jgi:hypothetical protein
VLRRFYDNFDMALLRAMCAASGFTGDPLGEDGSLTAGARQALSWHHYGSFEWVDGVVVAAWHRKAATSDLPGEVVLEVVVATTYSRALELEGEVPALVAGALVHWVDEDSTASLVGPLA